MLAKSRILVFNMRREIFITLFLISSSNFIESQNIVESSTDVSDFLKNEISFNVNSSENLAPGGFDAIKLILPKIFNDVNSMTLLKVVMTGRKYDNVSTECKEALANLTMGLDMGSREAFDFVDATGKLQAGIGQGGLALLGSFDQCLQADYPNHNDPIFHGKYCSVYIKTDMKAAKTLMGGFKPTAANGLNFRLDLCLPNLCNERDIEIAINSQITEKLKPFELFGLSTDLLSSYVGVCQVRDTKPLSTGQILAMVVFAILATFLVSGTLFDIFLRLIQSFGDDTKPGNQDSVVHKILLSFSLYTNVLKLLNTDTGADSLTAVNGVRFLSMSWVILGHAYYFINPALIGNLLKTTNWGQDFAMQAILNATLSVDSFFFLSGLLVAYIAIKSLHRDGKINWGLYFFHRFWRLTPAYAAVILSTLLYPLIGSGPTWLDPNQNLINNCKKSWWVSLLYINNLYEPKTMCLGHGWYLSNDMQFYILSPIILLALYKYVDLSCTHVQEKTDHLQTKPVLGFFVNFLFLLASVVTPAVLGVVKNYPPTVLFLDATDPAEYTGNYFNDIYITPYCRMGPYCVGIYAGYFLARTRKLNLSKIIKTILWCLAIACNISVLYGTFEWNKGNRSSKAIDVLYMATHRTAWSLGLAWVVIACATNNGGIVNSILSWKLFVPLGRMTYLAYLIHPMIQLAYSGIIRERLMYTHYSWITMFLGFLVVSYGIAFAGSLAFEAPFLGLEKVLLPKKTPAPKKPINQVTNGVDNKAYENKL